MWIYETPNQLHLKNWVTHKNPKNKQKLVAFNQTVIIKKTDHVFGDSSLPTNLSQLMITGESLKVK